MGNFRFMISDLRLPIAIAPSISQFDAVAGNEKSAQGGVARCLCITPLTACGYKPSVCLSALSPSVIVNVPIMRSIAI